MAKQSFVPASRTKNILPPGPIHTKRIVQLPVGAAVAVKVGDQTIHLEVARLIAGPLVAFELAISDAGEAEVPTVTRLKGASHA